MMGPPWCRICRLAHLLEEAPAHADVDGVATSLVRSEGRFRRSRPLHPRQRGTP